MILFAVFGGCYARITIPDAVALFCTGILGLTMAIGFLALVDRPKA